MMERTKQCRTGGFPRPGSMPEIVLCFAPRKGQELLWRLSEIVVLMSEASPNSPLTYVVEVGAEFSSQQVAIRSLIPEDMTAEQMTRALLSIIPCDSVLG